MKNINTIKNAITSLSNICDGARTKDNVGYNGYDSQFAQSLIHRLTEVGSLTNNQEQAAYNMLKKYKNQLSNNFEIDYDQIPKPNQIENPKVEKTNNSSWTVEMKEVSWNKPRKINTKSGSFYVYNTSNFPKWFWGVWETHKSEIKEAGYSISKYNGSWQLCKWEKVVKKEQEKTSLKDINLEHSTHLLTYQIPHVKQLIISLTNHNVALDSSDTGTGKTYSTLSVAKELDLYPIVLTPKSVKYSFTKVMENHFKIKGFVSNYEQFKFNKTPYLTRTVNGKEETFTWKVPDNALIIFDEVHRCKNYKTQNAKMLVAAKNQGLKVIAMSATIGTNPLDMYALGYLLELFDSPSGFFKWIKNNGCIKGQWGGFEFVGGIQALQKIQKQIYPEKGSRISITDLGDLFPETKIIADCFEMENEKSIKRTLDDLSKYFDTLDNKKPEHHLPIMQKARQKVELSKVPTFVELAQDAIEEGHNVAIFVNYNDTIRALSNKLKTNCIIWGNNKPGERDKMIEDFQSDKKHLIICNIKAGGVGINLQDLNGKHSRVSLISPDWSAENLLQVLGRVHRAGSKTKSLQKIVFCANTIEEEICDAVRTKIENIHTLNEGDLRKGLNF